MKGVQNSVKKVKSFARVVDYYNYWLNNNGRIMIEDKHMKFYD